MSEWREVSDLRVVLESSNHLVDYHGGEILDRLDEAPRCASPATVETVTAHSPDGSTAVIPWDAYWAEYYRHVGELDAMRRRAETAEQALSIATREAS